MRPFWFRGLAPLTKRSTCGCVNMTVLNHRRSQSTTTPGSAAHTAGYCGCCGYGSRSIWRLALLSRKRGSIFPQDRIWWPSEPKTFNRKGRTAAPRGRRTLLRQAATFTAVIFSGERHFTEAVAGRWEVRKKKSGAFDLLSSAGTTVFFKRQLQFTNELNLDQTCSEIQFSFAKCMLNQVSK